MGPLLSLIYTLANALAFPWLAWRVVSTSGLAGLRARFGADLGEALSSSIWLHGASVGEVNLLRPLVARFERDHPDMPLLITTSSPTGLLAAREAYKNHRVVPFPFDMRFVIRRYVRRFNPSLAVFVESEFWPNCLAVLRASAIPVAVVNGKMSAKSFEIHRRTRIVAHGMRGIDLVAAQTEEHAERMRQLGVDEAKVCVTGNMKYDLTDATVDRAAAARRRVALGYGERTTVVIAGSLHDDEHEEVLEAFSSVRRESPETAFILVPRYPDDAERMLAAARRHGFAGVRFTELADAATQRAHEKILVVDTVGELRGLYSIADIAFVGGSLHFRASNKGGHNLMEPAVVGLPVIFGPYHFSFKETADALLGAAAGREVASASELGDFLIELIRDAEARHLMGERARQVVAAARGATERNYTLITDLMQRGEGVLAAQGH
jgi:3-deoxy-D-manno-octulosonic-acid transferase